MSIVVYSGLPGSGKSYGVTENSLLPAVQSGRVVVTNIELSEKFYEDYPNAEIITFKNHEPEEKENFWSELPAGAVIIIDEAWRWWPSGLKASNMPERIKEFFTMHRHKVSTSGFTQEIVLVTQDAAQLCAFVRNLIEETFRSKKLSALGASKKYRIDVYSGAPTGQNIPDKLRLRQIFGSYKKEIYQYYKSHTMNEGKIAGTEDKADKRGNIFKSPFFRFVFPVALLMVVFGIYSGVQAFKGITAPPKTQIAQAQPVKTEKPVYTMTPQQFEQVQQQLPKKPPEPKLSRTWRIKGVIEGKEKSIVYVSSASGERTLSLNDFCKQAPDWKCTIDNEIVTFYSGFASHNLVADGFSQSVTMAENSVK